MRELKVTIPEDLNFTGVFDDIFEKLTVSHKLRRVKTSNMGSLYQLTYTLELKNPECEKELIDEMRCRNGNIELSVNGGFDSFYTLHRGGDQNGRQH